MLKLKKYTFIALVSMFASLHMQATEIIMRDEPMRSFSPTLTTTAIIEVYQDELEENFLGIVLIERGKAPFGKAIPRGKVEIRESVEHAVRREMQREVGLELNDVRQFHVYSDPKGDFRHHSVEVTHIAKAYQSPRAGGDAVKTFIVPLDRIPWSELVFDHATVLKDYIDWKHGNESVIMARP